MIFCLVQLWYASLHSSVTCDISTLLCQYRINAYYNSGLMSGKHQIVAIVDCWRQGYRSVANQDLVLPLSWCRQ